MSAGISARLHRAINKFDCCIIHETRFSLNGVITFGLAFSCFRSIQRVRAWNIYITIEDTGRKRYGNKFHWRINIYV